MRLILGMMSSEVRFPLQKKAKAILYVIPNVTHGWPNQNILVSYEFYQALIESYVQGGNQWWSDSYYSLETLRSALVL